MTVTPPQGALSRANSGVSRKGRMMGGEPAVTGGWASGTGSQTPRRRPQGWAGALRGRRRPPRLISGMGMGVGRGLLGPGHARGTPGQRPPSAHTHNLGACSGGGPGALPDPGAGRGAHAQPVPEHGDPPYTLMANCRCRNRQEEAQRPLTPPLPGLCATWPPAPFPHSVPPGSHRHRGCRRSGPYPAQAETLGGWLLSQASGVAGATRQVSSGVGVQHVPRFRMPAGCRPRRQAQRSPLEVTAGWAQLMAPGGPPPSLQGLPLGPTPPLWVSSRAQPWFPPDGSWGN